MDYHIRRHELAGDDVKHKQDIEYNKSVEEELMKRTEKEAALREAERAKMKAQEDAEYSEIVKQSLELEAEGMYIFCVLFQVSLTAVIIYVSRNLLYTVF